MNGRRNYRIVLTVACFLLAGLNGYKVLKGNRELIDYFLVVVFLLIGFAYLFLLMRKDGTGRQ